jgi:hypothetical protein
MGEVMDGRVVAVAADAVGLESLVVVRAVVVSERVTPVQTKPVTADVRHGPQQTQEREEPEQGTAPHCDSLRGVQKIAPPGAAVNRRGSSRSSPGIAFVRWGTTRSMREAGKAREPCPKTLFMPNWLGDARSCRALPPGNGR